MNLFGFGGTPIIEITLDGADKRKLTKIKDRNGEVTKLPVYTGDDDLSGTVNINLNKLKKFEHLGIKVELIGHIEILFDKNLSSDFMTQGKELEPAGVLSEDKSYKFMFAKFDKEVETYNGSTGKLRYFVRVSINRNYQSKITKEIDFAVLLPQPIEDKSVITKPIKLEVGIEECLHIEFEYNKNRYHLKDCIAGKVQFFLIKIKIKYMEIQLIKKEVFGQGQSQQTDSETLVKYEVMDGSPYKGEVIPIRLFLNSVDLTPSHKNIGGKFSVKHFISLVLVDEDDRRYFKQQELTFYRLK